MNGCPGKIMIDISCFNIRTLHLFLVLLPENSKSMVFRLSSGACTVFHLTRTHSYLLLSFPNRSSWNVNPPDCLPLPPSPPPMCPRSALSMSSSLAALSSTPIWSSSLLITVFTGGLFTPRRSTPLPSVQNKQKMNLKIP